MVQIFRGTEDAVVVHVFELAEEDDDSRVRSEIEGRRGDVWMSVAIEIPHSQRFCVARAVEVDAVRDWQAVPVHGLTESAIPCAKGDDERRRALGRENIVAETVRIEVHRFGRADARRVGEAQARRKVGGAK